MRCIIGIDVGGTNIKLGKFDEKKLLEKYFVKTQTGETEEVLINQIISQIDSLLKDDELIGIGIGIPGPVVDGVVCCAQNINWGEVNLKEILSAHYPNIPIAVMNDANCATLGEWYFGSGEKKPNTVFITLGTGVGGGIIVNNQLIEGETGSSGELGHIKIFPYGGRECTCGLTGCLEQYASATGILKTARGMMNNGNTKLRLKPRLNAKDVFEYAKNGDEISMEVVDKTAYYLGIGIASITCVLNPNVVIIGGGVSKAGDFFLEKIRKEYEKLAFYSMKKTKIVLASLYNDAGIYGCFAKIKQMLDNINNY